MTPVTSKRKCGHCFSRGAILGKPCPKCNKPNLALPQPSEAFAARWAATNGPAKPE